MLMTELSNLLNCGRSTNTVTDHVPDNSWQIQLFYTSQLFVLKLIKLPIEMVSVALFQVKNRPERESYCYTYLV